MSNRCIAGKSKIPVIVLLFALTISGLQARNTGSDHENDCSDPVCYPGTHATCDKCVSNDNNCANYNPATWSCVTCNKWYSIRKSATQGDYCIRSADFLWLLVILPCIAGLLILLYCIRGACFKEFKER